MGKKQKMKSSSRPRPPSGGGTTSGVSLDPAKWNFLYGKDTPSHPTKDGSGFKFAFPKKPGQVDYLQTDYTKAMSGNFKVSGSVDLNGEFWAADDDQPPCHFSLLVRKGKDLTEEYNRFWYFHFPLVAGPFNISVPLDGVNWISVFGKKDPTRFKQLIKSPTAIGITFGGQSFAGHGVGMKSGSATFHVSSIVIG